MRIPCLRGLRAAGTTLLVLAAAAPLSAQQINTGTPPAGPSWPKNGLGGSDVQYVSAGQTFTVPTGLSLLDQFQFWLGQVATFESVPYRAYLYRWDPAARVPVGSYLYRSALQTGTSAPGPLPASFATGGLALDAGQMYAAILSSVESPLGPTAAFGGAFMSTAWVNDGYAGGEAWARFSAASAGLSGLTSAAWTRAGGVTTGGDFAFTATFGTAQQVVPEPGTVALLATGLLALGVVARRPRR